MGQENLVQTELEVQMLTEDIDLESVASAAG